MAKFQNAPFFGFKGGLNTTSSPLNMPPEDSVDLSNVVLGIDGSVKRRKAIDFLGPDSSGNIFASSDVTDYSTIVDSQLYNESMSVFEFTPVSSSNELKRFVVVHVGTEIRIYDYSIPRNLKDLSNPAYSISLSLFDNTQALHKTQFVQDRNRIFIINAALPYMYIDYDGDLGTFDRFTDYIYVRNLEQDAPTIDSVVQDGGKAYKCIRANTGTTDNRPGSGTNWRDYWVFDGTAVGTEPAWSATTPGSKVTSYWTTPALEGADDEWSASFECIASNTNVQPGVHPNWSSYWRQLPSYDLLLPTWLSTTTYTISAQTYNTNIETFSDDVSKGFTTGCTASGRLWLGGSVAKPNTVVFSQSLIIDKGYSRMYQYADPYSGTDTDVVDTDGGTITITGVEKILKLVSYNEGVLVFGTNGVWHITGSDGFNPTNYMINKVSDNGAIGADGVVDIEGQVVYFGRGDVFAVSSGNTDILGKPDALNISVKITDFYNSISNFNRSTGKAVYHDSEKKIYFFTNFEDTNWRTQQNKFNSSCCFRDVLIYDVRLKSWYKYSLTQDAVGDKVFLGDAFTLTGGVDVSADVEASGDGVVTSGGDIVVATDPTVVGKASTLNVAILQQNGTSFDWAFGEMGGDGFSDFSEAGVLYEETYSSFITFAHQTFNDQAHTKFAPYIIPIFRRVESNILDNQGFDITPGGCFYRVDWNWSVNSNSNRFGTLRQCYFPYKITTGRLDGTDPGFEVVSSKLKIRGQGDVMRVHFESDGDKDFNLLGFQMLVHAAGKV